MQPTREREAFEQWFAANNYAQGSSTKDEWEQIAWGAWQAALKFADAEMGQLAAMYKTAVAQRDLARKERDELLAQRENDGQ